MNPVLRENMFSYFRKLYLMLFASLLIGTVCMFCTTFQLVGVSEYIRAQVLDTLGRGTKLPTTSPTVQVMTLVANHDVAWTYILFVGGYILWVFFLGGTLFGALALRGIQLLSY